jgi:hypothetical protein
LEESVEKSKKATEARILLSIPTDEALLRFQSHPSSFSLSTIDLAKCLNDGSYVASRLLDAFRFLSSSSSSSIVDPVDGDWDNCINSFTLPHFRPQVENASFFTDITDVRDDFVTLLSKLLNSRCQARKYGTVAEKRLLLKPAEVDALDRAMTRNRLARKGPATRDIKTVSTMHAKVDLTNVFIRILLCSLLGNYPHCNTRILGLELRKKLYDLLYYNCNQSRLQAHAFHFFQGVLHQCPSLVKWCLRDYLVSMIQDNPALRSQVETVMRLDDFCRITNQAMDCIRSYVQTQSVHAWSNLGQYLGKDHADESETVYCTCLQPRKLRSSSECHYRHHTWMHDLTILLAPFHELMLRFSYHKPDAGIIGFLLGKEVRVSCAPLVPLPNAPTEEDIAMEEEDEVDADLDDVLEDIVVDNLRGHSQDGFRDAQRRHQYKKDQERRDKEATTRFMQYLTPSQFQELSWIVENTQSEVHTLVSEWFQFFGVRQETIDAILVLFDAHRSGSVTKYARLRMVKEIQHTQPHAYNLLQISAELLRMHQLARPRVIGKLPLATVQAQIAAVQKRWGSGSIVDASSLCLFYCGVCGEIYSHVQDEASSVHYKYYRFGLGNVWHEYSTGQVFCSRNKVNHRGACISVPLVRVNLLGIRFAYQKKVYQLCVSCGSVMVPGGKRARDCGVGELCKACSSVTEDIVTVPLTEFKEQMGDRRCCCCSRASLADSTTFMLVHGLIVCRHCFRKGVAYHFGRLDQKPSTVEEAQKMAIKWYVEKKNKDRCKLVRQQKPQMARQKQRDRSRKA